MNTDAAYTAFAGDRRIASGGLRPVLHETKLRFDAGSSELVLIFEDESGQQVDFDLLGTPAEVLARALRPEPAPGPGRPRLGVVSREVSLLPRHWEWLEAQPNGISAAMRRLVEEARKREPEKERARIATEATRRVMTALAGNRPGFEEATRALYAPDWKRFDALVRPWPDDVRKYVRRLARGARLAQDAAAGMARDA